MADSILRLKVESSEYDNKLKRAAEGIRHLADVAHKGGGELTGLEKAELDYIKSLGDMETKSRSAAGQVRELESTYKELKVIYDQLNDVEKANEGGKALVASLEQIKTRAQEARTQLENASKSLQENADAGKEDSSVLAQLASKFTINIDAIKLFNVGLQAAKAALDVAKDAFFASETNVDEWGRTLRSADGIYQSFLQSLNAGDFSGFLNNIGQVTQAAREAYNALDELGTRMTIINPERAKLQARQQELRADIRRNGADSEVGKAALQELKKIEPLLSKSYKTESQMNYTAFEKLVRERLAEGGINLNQKSFNDFMKTFSNDAAFQSLRKNARGSLTTEMTGNAYNPNAVMTRRTVDTRNTEQKLLDLFTDEWRNANSGYLTAAFNAQGAAASNMLGNSRYMRTTTGGGSGGGGGNTTTTTGIKDEFTGMEELVGLIPVAEQKVKDLQQQIRESWDEGEIERLREDLKLAQAELDGLNGKAQKIDLNKMFPERGVSDGASQSFGQQIAQSINVAMAEAAQNADIQTLRTLLETQIKNGIEGIDIPTDALMDQIIGEGMDIPDEYWQNLQDQINAKLAEMEIDPINIDFKTGESSKEEKKEPKELTEFKEFNQKAGQFISGLQSVSSGLKGLGIQLPTGVDQLISAMSSVMQIIQGVQAIISVFSISAMAANTAAIIANTIALTTNSAMQIIPFARGGIVPHAANGYYVPGNHYSNDVTPIMANAGELILNKAAQGNLASQLSDGGLGNLYLETRVDAEDLIIMINNNGMRRGLGKLING